MTQEIAYYCTSLYSWPCVTVGCLVLVFGIKGTILQYDRSVVLIAIRDTCDHFASDHGLMTSTQFGYLPTRQEHYLLYLQQNQEEDS